MLNDHPRKQLQIIITQIGHSICEEPKRCEAMLRDFCPEHKREVNLLVTALKEKVAHDLLNRPALMPLETTLKNLSQRLQDNHGTAEHFADWAVESWALSLNMLQTPSAKLAHSPLEHDMVLIKGGTFLMGCPDSHIGQHEMQVNDFYMGKYLVTQTQWQAVMDDNPSYFKGDNLPVECVSWWGVQNFITKLNFKTGQNYRLPTEEEWEYACRGGTTTPYYTGFVITEKDANACRIIKKTTVVGSYPPNPYGLYDMTGNVREWTESEYQEYYLGEKFNNGELVVLRGGSWKTDPEELRSTARSSYRPDNGDNSRGFRLARDITS
jgi:formylglycine-generating enzyme required for sulfatase activity